MAVKERIIDKLCYTDLVYGRINKKLDTSYSKKQISSYIEEILKSTNEKYYVNTGKNYYVTNNENNIRITINSNTYRVITVDRIEKLKNISNLATRYLIAQRP